MPHRTAVAALLLAMAAPAVAQQAAPPEPVTRSFDGPRASGSTSIVRAEGSVSRDSEVTRKRDGATMTSSQTRSRDDSGVSREASRTGFDGRTASGSYQRTRTDSGFVETGSATGPGGRSYTLEGSGSRTENGHSRARSISTDDGRTIASRRVDVSRGDGRISRDAEASGPQRLLSRRDGRAGRRMARRG
jgi:hypothetical protein